MKNKVKGITERRPQIATLPDGLYIGVWGGYVIEVNYSGKVFELETEEGIRGVGFKVVVEVIDGIATFESVKV